MKEYHSSASFIPSFLASLPSRLRNIYDRYMFLSGEEGHDKDFIAIALEHGGQW
jgi:hypothetical protein